MSFLSGLKVFGQDIVKVFSWAASPKGQAVVAAGEAVAETAFPVSVPIINLANAWFAKAYQVETLAVAANQATGTGPDKAALAMQTITPQVLAYAQQEGVSPRTAAQIQAANDAIVAFIKAMTQPAA